MEDLKPTNVAFYDEIYASSVNITTIKVDIKDARSVFLYPYNAIS